MSTSPFPRLDADFMELFGGRFESRRLIELASPVPNDARGLALDHADGVAADEQQHHNGS